MTEVAYIPQNFTRSPVFNIIERISMDYIQRTEVDFTTSVLLCSIVTKYRTFIDDLYKVLEFVEWYKRMVLINNRGGVAHLVKV